MPAYPGGEEAMMRFIQSNINYPDMERENDIQGRVVVGFVVLEDGTLSDIQIKKGVSSGIDKEALRVVRKLPKFNPGKQQGKAVKVSFVLPIMFKLASQ
jgi:protein TonB